MRWLAVHYRCHRCHGGWGTDGYYGQVLSQVRTVTFGKPSLLRWREPGGAAHVLGRPQMQRPATRGVFHELAELCPPSQPGRGRDEAIHQR